MMSLIIDVVPVYGVLVLGWGAVPLVFLYWLENLVIGGVTVLRMLAAGSVAGPAGLLAAGFLSVFFTFHYGLFCFVHGVFLMSFAAMGAGADPGFPGPVELIGFALQSGPGMGMFIALIAAYNLAIFVVDDLLRGEAANGTTRQAMMAPYGRVVVLHIAIFAGAGGLIALGQPMLGVLALIGLRILFGIILSVRRRLRLESTRANTKVDAASQLG